MQDSEKLKNFVHGKLLEILKFIDSVCTAENIQYSLAGGTMLGAVRHDGFIPWDDDADVVMTRDGFEKFKTAAPSYLDGTPFKLCKNGRVDGVMFAEPQDFENGKIGHLCTDIFLLDNVPDDDKAYKKQIFGLKKLQGMMKKGKINWKRYSLKGKILVLGTKILGAFQSEKRLLDKYAKLSSKYNGTDTARRFISNDLYAYFDIAYDKDIVSETVLHKFEDCELPIYKQYNKMLTLMYGDYMTPPPVEEQVFAHTEMSGVID